MIKIIKMYCLKLILSAEFENGTIALVGKTAGD